MRRRWIMGLGLLFLTAAGAAVAWRWRPSPAPPPEPYRVTWTLELNARGAVVATPLVTPDRLFVAAVRDNAFNPRGAVHCYDRTTHQPLWTFDDGGAMIHTISGPCLADGRLFVGEGMHGNHACKFYALDAATGHKLWDFQAAGHIESSPAAAAGRVYFAAGDDGVFCLDAATGARVWQFQGPFHIDSSPAVVGGRVYVGSGLSRTYRRTEVVCLDAASGAVVWRTPVELPAWGSPVADGDQVFVGLGNGRLNRSVEPPEVPAGALLCLDAATGRPRWRHAVADGVLARPTVAAARVYFGARDGYLYALGRHDGSVIWRTAADGPVVTAVALSRNRVYAAAATGQLKALDAATGAVTWTYDAGARTRTRPQLFAAPVARQDPAGTCVYLGAELRNAVNSAAAVFCLEERADGREP